VTGDADSYSNFQPSAGAFQSTSSNFQGSVVVKFAAAPAMVLRSSSDRLDANTPVTLTATLAGPGVSGNVVFLDGSAAIGNAALAGNVATLSTTLPVGIHALTALLRIPGIAADTPVLYQIVDAPLACN
jgi:prepilin-type processing-associated H-X9-DG protein